MISDSARPNVRPSGTSAFGCRMTCPKAAALCPKPSNPQASLKAPSFKRTKDEVATCPVCPPEKEASNTLLYSPWARANHAHIIQCLRPDILATREPACHQSTGHSWRSQNQRIQEQGGWRIHLALVLPARCIQHPGFRKRPFLVSQPATFLVSDSVDSGKP